MRKYLDEKCRDHTSEAALPTFLERSLLPDDIELPQVCKDLAVPVDKHCAWPLSRHSFSSKGWHCKVSPLWPHFHERENFRARASWQRSRPSSESLTRIAQVPLLKKHNEYKKPQVCCRLATMASTAATAPPQLHFQVQLILRVQLRMQQSQLQVQLILRVQLRIQQSTLPTLLHVRI